MILAGGTGGHIFPALAVAEQLRRDGCQVTWMGTRTGLEAKLVPAADIPIDWIGAAGVRGKSLATRLLAPFRLAWACLQAAGILLRRKPHVVLGMGGFVAAPGGLMAWLLRRPLVIHEQNRVPGTTNRMLSRLAKAVLEAFPGSFPPAVGARCTGNPLRGNIVALPAKSASDADRPLRVLVLGGSLGAKALNELLPEAAAAAGVPLDLRHQTGGALLDDTRRRYADKGVTARVEAFIDDMAAAYAWADLAVCRAGAMTVSELCAAGLPALLVPFPYAIDDHQTANARYLVDAGAAELMPQASLDAAALAAQLRRLADRRDLLAAMARQARALAKPDAAGQVANICLQQVRA
ncbi:UDP-N-acetylglucosamine--N-acetylmuramyl-(pentapeptide) pyrophosphoryl-undecaprenol N-acetylglucosamine transferase [Methylogaea oryzae]|uniref:UDP-N-acetylglucosamine--N-acetylmuramyl-(pentapeptide) pyrophosphoryl-undecaprenol N-acetylglucosamine transferase n=2 Tax=Methylogaea oryzae TaxID=1295382 RepID=A0A8D5ALL3_9GAMM|nr:UDP-N-acetylglucosamine--N-acetylmuramyl-(pentapeptide) pyrophosphoryl-undecaprenol N-acetylglucosamine transferase [Methylogaea oryzae]